MKFLIVAFFITSSFATELFTFNMGEFDVTTPDIATFTLLKKNTNCARSIVKAYMQDVVWENDMNDGVDLSESLDLEMLDITKDGSGIHFELYLSASEVIEGRASKARSGCLVDFKN